MKFTRQQELKLIDIGLETLINKTLMKQVKQYEVKKKLHWTQTPEGKSKMAKRMRKVWKDKRVKIEKI